MDAFPSHLGRLCAPSCPWSAPRDASGWVAPGVEVEARHVAGGRRDDVIPDTVPEDGVAEAIAVDRDRAAGRTEDDDGPGRSARRGTDPQTRRQRPVGVLDGGQPDVHVILIDVQCDAAKGLRDVAAALVQPAVIAPLAGP